MAKLPKLVITVTANASWIYPETKNHPVTPEEIADSTYESYKAGASIAHIHAAGQQQETARLIREKCDILVQFGLSGESLEMRRPHFLAKGNSKPDMISIIVTHHDEAFTKESFNILHEKPELEEYSRLCLKYDVKPEFECWNTGAFWNLRWLEQKKLIKKPYFLSIFFGWPGGAWSPPTGEELLNRVRNLPEGSMYTTSIMDPAQMQVSLLAIALGGHVRVGTEDYPYISPGKLAKNNTELVANIVELAKKMGREIATPAEARKMIGLKEA